MSEREELQGSEEKKEKQGEVNNRRNKGVRALIIFFLLLVIGAVTGFLVYRYRQTHISTDDAFVKGTVYTVSPKVPGTVLRVFVDDNEFVKKGDLLVKINPERYQVAVKGAEANLASARRALGEARARIKALEAALTLAEAKRDQARVDFERARDLYRKGAIPKSRFDRAETGLEVAEAAVEAKKAELEAAMASVKTLQARVKAAESALEDAKLKLSYTEVKAPGDGYVTRKNVEEGNFVAAGQPLMAVVSSEEFWVEANYKETQLEHVRVGDPVVIKIDTYPGRKLSGKVESIMAGTGSEFSLFPPENATGNYVKVVQRIPVKIVFTEPIPEDMVLRVGMSVVPTILVSR